MQVCHEKYVHDVDKQCLLFTSKRVAQRCRDYVQSKCSTSASAKKTGPHTNVSSNVDESPSSDQQTSIMINRHIQTTTTINGNTTNDQGDRPPSDHTRAVTPSQDAANVTPGRDQMQESELASSMLCTIVTVPVSSLLVLYVIVHRKEDFSIAKQFWQHAGEGISSRAAEFALRVLSEKRPSLNAEEESSVYLEERFGRNMELSQGQTAKNELRSRLAESFFAEFERKPQHDYSNDVYLFPSGMSSIYNAHRLLLGVFGPRKAIQFGYVDSDRSLSPCMIR